MMEPLITETDRDPGSRKVMPAWKVWVCYASAGLFTVLILATLIGAVSALLPESWSDTVTVWRLFEYSGLAFLIIFFTRFFGDIWRGSGEDLKLGFTDFPNPFYDRQSPAPSAEANS